ncbi:hypothetical protein U3516DRAFT_837526 [Neocallimastix sp. 'constans']
MKNRIIITLCLYLIGLSYFEFLRRSYAIKINFLTSTTNIVDKHQEGLVNDFNIYSKENHLNITLERTCLSPQNVSVKVSNYASFIELKLKKKNTNYDLILIDNIYTNLYSNYVVDINKLVSVPLFIDSEILYSNRKLLDRYDEKPPETWDELIRIASKIKKK